jgi:hypothetical protein
MSRHSKRHWNSLKTLAQSLPTGSAEQVVCHGFWQQQRKRAPSMQFAGKKNPRHAYARALQIIGLTLSNVSAVMLRTMYDRKYRRRMRID